MAAAHSIQYLIRMQDHLNGLIGQSIGRTYGSGSMILYQGEVPRSVCVLKRGVVRVYSISSQGDDQIVTYHVDGEFFPASWVFGKSPSTLFFYEAVTDCEVGWVPRDTFLEYIYELPERTEALVDYLATSYSGFLIRINALEQPKARQKLLYTLYYLCQRYGATDGEQIRIVLALTHQHIAALVGLTRETTATEMNRLRKEGVLDYTAQTYTVDTQRLLDAIGEDSFRGIKI